MPVPIFEHEKEMGGRYQRLLHLFFILTRRNLSYDSIELVASLVVTIDKAQLQISSDIQDLCGEVEPLSLFRNYLLFLLSA